MSPESKETIRKSAIERRAALRPRIAELSAAIGKRFLESVPLPPDAVISSYWAIGDEADPGRLEHDLRRRGHRIVMPRVAGRELPLDFHLWPDGAVLVPGKFGLSEPPSSWPKATPTILIVPLLAFDGQGFRVGYGAGYYDRTIRQLRATNTIIAAGFAFAAQEFPAVPHFPHDERLDWVVTETHAHRMQAN